MEKEQIEVFHLQYKGKRFEQHTMPLELLEDLAVLGELTIEMAKYVYLEEHPDRQRVIRNYAKGISFELVGIEAGSTLPQIVMVQTGANPLGMESFKQAESRIIDAVANAQEDPTRYMPHALLKKFERLGKNLKNDESIVMHNGNGSSGTYSRQVRKQLVLASSLSRKYSDATVLRGFVAELDLQRRVGHLILVNGQRFGFPFPDELTTELKEAFLTFDTPQRQRVALQATALFSENDQLQKVEEIEGLTFLDPLDIDFRLDELILLKEGWLDGQGKELPPAATEWLRKSSADYLADDLPLPFIFPTPEGSIQFEWSTEDFEASLHFLLPGKEAEFQMVALTDKAKDSEAEWQLEEEEDWIKLKTYLKGQLCP